MTGLVPARHVIVEIATLVTDDDLNIVAEGPDLVVHQPTRRAGEMDPIVSRCIPAAVCSTLSGLDVDAGRRRRADASSSSSRTSRRLARVPLCGNSIGMDRRFLAAYLPEIEEYLHYRSVDVSTVKELVKRWYPALNSSRPRKTGAHRALDE